MSSSSSCTVPQWRARITPGNSHGYKRRLSRFHYVSNSIMWLKVASCLMLFASVEVHPNVKGSSTLSTTSTTHAPRRWRPQQLPLLHPLPRRHRRRRALRISNFPLSTNSSMAISFGFPKVHQQSPRNQLLRLPLKSRRSRPPGVAASSFLSLAGFHFLVQRVCLRNRSRLHGHFNVLCLAPCLSRRFRPLLRLHRSLSQFLHRRVCKEQLESLVAPCAFAKRTLNDKRLKMKSDTNVRRIHFKGKGFAVFKRKRKTKRLANNAPRRRKMDAPSLHYLYVVRIAVSSLLILISDSSELSK